MPSRTRSSPLDAPVSPLPGRYGDTESLLTAAGDVQDILSLSSRKLEQMAREHQRPGKAQQDTHAMTQCLRTRCWISESTVIVVPHPALIDHLHRATGSPLSSLRRLARREASLKR
jgi:hypothetical protein